MFFVSLSQETTRKDTIFWNDAYHARSGVNSASHVIADLA